MLNVELPNGIKGASLNSTFNIKKVFVPDIKTFFLTFANRKKKDYSV